MLKLRQWQKEALSKALEWLVKDKNDKHFLVNAAPGSGKTLFSCALAKTLIELDEIDRIIVIAPRREVVNQWADDFRRVTGRHMTKVTAGDGDVSSLELDVCATWSAIQGLSPELQAICRNSKTLVICDEHHHAAVRAAWGDSADSAFVDAKYVLILTGTPIRSDGEQSIWLAYDSVGRIDHPVDGTYTLTYGEAVDLGYCRPVTFHRHEGKFTVNLDDDHTIHVSGSQQARLPNTLARIPGLQQTLEFYRLAKTPLYETDKVTPLLDGYQATMLEYGGQKLTELRYRMPNAGGLVIAPNIEMAEYMCDLLERLEGEKPILVHSQLSNPEAKIKAFRESAKRWLVSVAMVSEGVDIKRLRVLINLPNSLTELAFRQAIGRVVRTMGHDDDTRAYVVIPAFETLEVYARRVEEEMPQSTRGAEKEPRTKRCSVCGSECHLGAKICPHCEHEFPIGPSRLKPCPDCGALNPATLTECHSCGASLLHDFTLTLDEALRTGAIVRGMDIDEDEVRLAEEMAPKVRSMILKSGDQRFVRILKTLPDESWSRLKTIMVANE